MPQMAPLWWEYLFIMFSMTMSMLLMMIYHWPHIKSNNLHYNKKGMNQMNWMW
nr:ATP synthase F0 subunit 8 [Megacopta cribriella]